MSEPKIGSTLRRVLDAGKRGELFAVPQLTATRRIILEEIVGYTDAHGYPPTVRELCAAVGLGSTSSVQHHLLALEKSGHLRRDGSKARALTVTDPDAFREGGD